MWDLTGQDNVLVYVGGHFVDCDIRTGIIMKGCGLYCVKLLM